MLGMATVLLGTGIGAAQAQRVGETPSGNPSAQTVVITPTADANTLATTVLGTGFTVSNVTFSGGTGSPFSAGLFDNGLSSGIGLDEGIILTSGNALLAPGPNNSGSAGASIGTPGDPGIPGSQDATVLEFDFETTTGDIFIEYVFASEEYNEFVNTGFNDAFAFFLDGTNIALIPGTSTPVEINTVNLGENSAFYKNNSPGPFDLQYDGLTVPLLASATGLSPGTHTIRLVIADRGDSIYDSAVFIEGITTVAPPPGTPEPATVAGLAALGALGATLKRSKKASK